MRLAVPAVAVLDTTHSLHLARCPCRENRLCAEPLQETDTAKLVSPLTFTVLLDQAVSHELATTRLGSALQVPSRKWTAPLRCMYLSSSCKPPLCEALPPLVPHTTSTELASPRLICPA